MDCDGNELLLSDILGTDGDEISRPLEDDVDLCVLRQALRELYWLVRCMHWVKPMRRIK